MSKQAKAFLSWNKNAETQREVTICPSDLDPNLSNRAIISQNKSFLRQADRHTKKPLKVRMYFQARGKSWIS